jgi:hypothetical protein
MEERVTAADRALELAGPETRINPGHSPLSNRLHRVGSRQLLIEIRDCVRKWVEDAEDRTQGVAARPGCSVDAESAKGLLGGPEPCVVLVDEGLVAGRSRSVRARGIQGLGGADRRTRWTRHGRGDASCIRQDFFGRRRSASRSCGSMGLLSR